MPVNIALRMSVYCHYSCFLSGKSKTEKLRHLRSSKQEVTEVGFKPGHHSARVIPLLGSSAAFGVERWVASQASNNVLIQTDLCIPKATSASDCGKR